MCVVMVRGEVPSCEHPSCRSQLLRRIMQSTPSTVLHGLQLLFGLGLQTYCICACLTRRNRTSSITSKYTGRGREHRVEVCTRTRALRTEVQCVHKRTGRTTVSIETHGLVPSSTCTLLPPVQHRQPIAPKAQFKTKRLRIKQADY